MEKQKQMTPLVIYHANCWDGFCAAWVARKALGEIEAFPGYDGSAPPAVAGRVVYILDFSYPRDVMERIATDARRLVVLDHHKTAAEALDGLDQPESGIDVWFDMAKSGGRLTWEWFTRCDGPSPSDVFIPPSPWLVDYTEDRDLWRHALPESENINAALRSYPLNFDLWDRLGNVADVINGTHLVQEGKAIRRAERQIVDTHVRNAREIEMDGHRVKAVNATVLFSEIAGELAKGRAFGACYFDRQDGRRQWSLRSDAEGVDVSAIAKAHGGGGHRQAAGFESAI